jgi:putative FmdB family regulatory protein
VAIYEYQCEQDGRFDVVRPLGTAPPFVACTVCGGESRRVISAPMLRTGSRSAWTAAIDRADKSRFEPEVVTSLPSNGVRGRTLSMTPALRSLPRP